MSILKRAGLWYARRRIVKLIKEASKMTPLPKWVAWLGNLGAVGSILTSFAGILPAKYGVLIAGFAGLLNSISHSLPGTGGK